jgi:hypothetical protein
MPCDALARVNATIATQTLVAELFRRPDVTPVVLQQLLLHLDGIVAARCEVTASRLTLDLTTTAETLRLTLDADTGRLWTQTNAQALLDRVRPLLEETGGALLQERVVQTLRTVYGSRAEEVPTGGTARRVALRL